MINRLVAENILKTTLKGQTCMAINKKMLAYGSQKMIKVKSLIHKDTKELEIPLSSVSFSFSLSTQEPFLQTLTSDKLLCIYHLKSENGAILCKKVLELAGILSFKQVHGGLAVVEENFILKFIEFSAINVQTPICKCSDNSSILKVANEGSGIFIRSEQEVKVFDRRSKDKYQQVASFHSNKVQLGIFNDRYIFQCKDQEVEIYDISDCKIIGKFDLVGTIKFCSIKQNLMVVVLDNETSDIYNFFILNRNRKVSEPLIEYRIAYQKSKSDNFEFINVEKREAQLFTESKKKEQKEVSDMFPTEVSNETCSILFTSSKEKEKVQIFKIDHAKILENKFSERTTDVIVSSSSGQTTKIPRVEVEKARMESVIENKESDRSEKATDEIQQKFIQKIVESKMRIFAKKFMELEKRVVSLERTIQGIYQRMQDSLKEINRSQVKKSVEDLFVQLTPQFEKYFTEVFKQVSGVLQQGTCYYNYKLQKEAEIHKEALTEIVKLSFKATDEIVQLSKKELKYSESTKDVIKELGTLKKNWVEKTQAFEGKMKHMKNSPDQKSQIPGGKVFVRADLSMLDKQTG